MSDIQCSFSAQGSSTTDSITARLKKPVGFKGAPLFADDRSVNPEADRHCIIRQDPTDQEGVTYVLKITDFSRCGVLKRNVGVNISIMKSCNLCLSLFFSGFCSCSNMVSTISWCCNAIRSRTDYYV